MIIIIIIILYCFCNTVHLIITFLKIFDIIKKNDINKGD